MKPFASMKIEELIEELVGLHQSIEFTSFGVKDLMRKDALITHLISLGYEVTEEAVLVILNPDGDVWEPEGITPDYEKAYNLMMEYFDSIADEEKEDLHKKLQELGV